MNGGRPSYNEPNPNFNSNPIPNPTGVDLIPERLASFFMLCDDSLIVNGSRVIATMVQP
jgi:hypothetical protein